MKQNILRRLAEKALPVIRLDRFFGKKVRKALGVVFGSIALILLIASVLLRLSTYTLPASMMTVFAGVLSFVGRLPGIDITQVDYLSLQLIPYTKIFVLHLVRGLHYWNGVLILSLVCYAIIKMLGFFARSTYYSSLISTDRKGLKKPPYEILKIFASTEQGDLVRSFLRSEEGGVIALRLGLPEKKIARFLEERTAIIDYRENGDLAQVLGFETLSQILLGDHSVQELLNTHGLLDVDLLASARMLDEEMFGFAVRERSWGKIALSKLPALGEELSFGYGFYLKKYASQIWTNPAEYGVQYGGADVAKLEELLTRDAAANALLIAPAPHVAEEVVNQFGRDIVYHFKHKLLRNKRCFMFDAQYFNKQIDSAETFEQELGLVLGDAFAAGNVILVIEDFPALFLRAQKIGADISGIMRPYLQSNVLQIIAISDTAQYHSVLSSQTLLMEYFHDIHILEPGHELLLDSLFLPLQQIEWKYKLFFTVPALREIVKDAERTLVHGLLSDRVLEILQGLPPYLLREKVVFVLPEHVDAFVSAHTNMPVGKAKEGEQDRLLHLEKILHESIVGQDAAVTAVANALRRSRAGVRNEKKPTASFFFYGPTGVGKTEVAKTLARVFFGGEEFMHRFDMSEFSDDHALSRMIGGVGGAEGVLVAALRERPHGVLLLDEFEKGSSAIHDLFLQILDEGVFHDAEGSPVNCRNLIIIATSNVGASAIHARLSSGGAIDASFEKQVVSEIIASNMFKPELLNRFDGNIMFTQITDDGYRKIARLMLEKLAKRLREQGTILVINEALVDALVRKGVDPVFGARPMQRAVQDIVEQKVAEKLLKGEAGPGVPVELKESELQ